MSGSRLKARTTTTTTTSADGASYTTSYFGGWFDSQRNEMCAPGTASDGQTRCMPSAPAVQSTGYFADSGCTQRLISTSCSQPTPTFFAQAAFTQVGDAGACVAQVQLVYTVYSVGAQHADATVYIGSPASCIQTSIASTLSTTNYFRRGAEIPPSSFAPMTTTTVTQ